MHRRASLFLACLALPVSLALVLRVLPAASADRVSSTAFDQDLVEIELEKAVGRGFTQTGNAVLTVVSGNAVTFWGHSSRTNQIVNLSFAPQDLPKTIWMEAGAVSSAMRNIRLKWSYKKAADQVRATAVWANTVAANDVRHDNTEGIWDDMPAQPKVFVERYGNTFGLRPVNAMDRLANLIGFRFTLLPKGISDIPRVKFDISRHVEGKAWEDGTEDINARRDWPAKPNDAKGNDDISDEDESLVPTKDAMGNELLFSMDAVRLDSTVTIRNELVWRANFREFVRVSFDGVRPTGNRDVGARCSAWEDWNSRFRCRAVNGRYVRTTGDATESAENGIGPGHITVGNVP